MTRLILIRHGQSVWNAKNIFTGWVDVDLAPAGKLEAKQSGELIKQINFKPQMCFTSYLKRARDTLDIILKEINFFEDTNINIGWQLNERHYGSLQGLNKDETLKKFGEDQFLDADVKVPGAGVGVQAGGIANATLLYKGVDGWEISGNEFTSKVDLKVGAGSDLVSISSSTGNLSTQGTIAVDGSVTQSEAPASNNKVVTDVFSGKSAAKATWPAHSFIKTFTITNLNTAKYIVTTGKGANKTAIELLVVGDGTTIDGTAYGQVEIGTEQLVDIEIGVDTGMVGISVSAITDDTDVSITGSAHYNS